MPYYMTFFVDHPSGTSFSDIEAGLQAEDPTYRVEVLECGPTDSCDAADLYYGDDSYARSELNRPGEPREPDMISVSEEKNKNFSQRLASK